MVTLDEQVIGTAKEPAAARVRKTLTKAGALGVLLSGFPGSGKSALIEATARELGAGQCSVIIGSFDSTRDAEKLQSCCRQVAAVNTPRLETRHVEEAVAWMDLNELGVLFIETGSIASVPVAVDFGQHHRVGVFSVCGGDDKASQCPSLVRQSSAIVLGKLDLLEHVPFNLETFREDVRRLNPTADLIELTALRQQSLENWMSWIAAKRQPRKESPAKRFDWEHSEWFFG